MHIQNLPAELLKKILYHVSTTNDYTLASTSNSSSTSSSNSSAINLLNCALTCKNWSYPSLQLLWHKPIISKPQTWLQVQRVLMKQQQSSSYCSYGHFIRRLNLSAVADFISDDTLYLLVNCCQHLDRLTLTGCHHLTNRGLQTFLSLPSTSLLLSHLLSLDLSDIPHLSDETVALIANTCTKLQGLNLSVAYEEDIYGITDKSIIELAKNCNDLRRIRLSNWRSITDASVIALTTHCPSLLEIDVVHCCVTNQSLQSIFTHCKELRELKLNHCSQITDEGFLPLVLQQQPVTNLFAQLRILELTNLSFITDQSIDYITQAAPKIRNLVLNKCSRITDTAVMHYITRLGHQLHYLHLGNCKHITDQAIIQLVAHCPRIRYIDLTSCHRLTDTAVVALSTLQKLKRIGLVKCHRITNQAIFALARYQHKNNTSTSSSLERVHLSYCEQLTVPAIATLILQCRRLTHLSLSFIPAMQQEEVGQEIVQRFCRPPPREYNTPELQRTFCVFSGHKVFHELRKYFLTRQQQHHRSEYYHQYHYQQQQQQQQLAITSSMRMLHLSSSTAATTMTTTNTTASFGINNYRHEGGNFTAVGAEEVGNTIHHNDSGDLYRNAYAGGRVVYQYQHAERRRLPQPQQQHQQVNEVTVGLERTSII
ncbi:hypothetical protein BDF20DRAFT_817846 [Mycotypha africana]|uniref:uncharacterized protein n=1 Tax=Mycotypha africana TaxID=64632 RepID=UPI002300E661|nr:uncharacterized protein BDF20DRAFT_817846 [Mycotypha africana]KAI8982272.1 hypothetical protein BDF20DRAFT_817846 [Mycotypha africana]